MKHYPQMNANERHVMMVNTDYHQQVQRYGMCTQTAVSDCCIRVYSRAFAEKQY